MSSRYTIVGTLASGGMGTVYLARMAGSAGFSRLVAIKRLNPELATQKEFIAMLVDEARLASQVRHVNVIDTLDLVAKDGAFSLVLEYVEGAALSALISAAKANGEDIIPQSIAISVVRGMLRGLDAAHEARSPEGQPLGIVHRDVSPQNVLVGVDGIPRLIDFGIAKAMGRMTSTAPGELRGKFSYMAPEQLVERPATRQADVYAAGVLFWELLTGARLFALEDARAVAASVIEGKIRPPSNVNPDVSHELDAIVLKATARELSDRYETAREMIEALSPWSGAEGDEVGAWVRRLAAPQLAKRGELLQNLVPEESRSVEDLLAELEQSAAPPTSAQPPAQQIRIALPPPEREPEVTSSGGGVEVTAAAASVKKGNGRRWAVPVAAACVIGALILGGVFVGMRHEQQPSTPSANVPNASLPALFSSTPSASVNIEAPPTGDSPTAAVASVVEVTTTTPTPPTPTPTPTTTPRRAGKHTGPSSRPSPPRPTTSVDPKRPDPDKDHR